MCQYFSYNTTMSNEHNEKMKEWLHKTKLTKENKNMGTININTKNLGPAPYICNMISFAFANPGMSN